MRKKLELLYEMTENLMAVLPDSTPEDFEKLIRFREEVLSELVTYVNLTTADKELLKKIELNRSSLVYRMTELRNEAQVGLEKIRNSRMQRNVYESGYESGSYFIDRKK